MKGSDAPQYPKTHFSTFTRFLGQFFMGVSNSLGYLTVALLWSEFYPELYTRIGTKLIATVTKKD
ncbi:hypothetical protein PROFUN_12098 [Planoprotostelium fungivorum]|uniref:Uncharacterized protein n=1 Tax=Planoprotostelium fungivorum TaxID=1890364 RepID=A0A2P6N8D5_9EUKA|nr:hypothetical protein PROFUN_12098 [Planoprotostelium fungivorum]